MESIEISEFKARCISILKAVQAENKSLTHRDKPLVRIEPVVEAKSVLGGLRDQGRVKGELVGFDFDEEWEMEDS